MNGDPRRLLRVFPPGSVVVAALDIFDAASGNEIAKGTHGTVRVQDGPLVRVVWDEGKSVLDDRPRGAIEGATLVNNLELSARVNLAAVDELSLRYEFRWKDGAPPAAAVADLAGAIERDDSAFAAELRDMLAAEGLDVSAIRSGAELRADLEALQASTQAMRDFRARTGKHDPPLRVAEAKFATELAAALALVKCEHPRELVAQGAIVANENQFHSDIRTSNTEICMVCGSIRCVRLSDDRRALIRGAWVRPIAVQALRHVLAQSFDELTPTEGL